MLGESVAQCDMVMRHWSNEIGAFALSNHRCCQLMPKISRRLFPSVSQSQSSRFLPGDATWWCGVCRMYLLARNSFCVVAMTLGNSYIAGRNFSCKSQILAKHQRAHVGDGGANGIQEGGVCYPAVSGRGTKLSVVVRRRLLMRL